MAINPSTSTLHIALASNDSRHISQLFRLATSISQLGHHVSFVSTLSSIKAITIDQSSPDPSNLDLIPLQGDNGTVLKEEFNKFLHEATRDFDWVLFDVSTFWVPEISKKLGIHSAYIIFASVVASTFLWPAVCEPDFSKINQLMLQEFASPIAYYSDEATTVLYQLLSRDAQDLPLYYRINKAITMCDVVALPSYCELDEKFPQNLEHICQKKVLSFGHLLQTATNAVDNYLMNSLIIQEWLDKRGQCSVVYVAFEIELCITPQQVYAIAYGLEKSRFPFVWVIGNPQGGQTLELPYGFEERTTNYGLVCEHWVPHDYILSHPSIGGFLSNGSWSLCIEALNFGIPLILTPFSTAEAHNARLIEKKRLGYEVKKDPVHGVFRGVEVDQVLEIVMTDQGSGEIRGQANSMKGVFGNLQCSNLIDFLYHLDEIKKQKKVAGTKKNPYRCSFNECVICKGKRSKKTVGTDNNIKQSH
jgi:UDP-glucoronosyl and UDP-glucosyl transferase